MKTIHAVNAAPWQPGEETQILQTNRQTDRQTDKRTTVTRWARRDLGLIKKSLTRPTMHVCRLQSALEL